MDDQEKRIECVRHLGIWGSDRQAQSTRRRRDLSIASLCSARSHLGQLVGMDAFTNPMKVGQYCTISTKCSQDVTRDAREHYLAEFTTKFLTVTSTKSVHL
jgi:hypothetical protein